MAIPAIGALAQEIFLGSRVSEANGEVCIELGKPCEGETINVPKAIDDDIRSHLKQLKAPIRILFAHRKYEQFDSRKLEKKIQKTVERFLAAQGNSSTTASAANPKQPSDEEIFKKIVHLLSKKVKETNEKAKGKEVVLFVGPTGAGKSTMMNYLLDCKMEKLSQEESESLGASVARIIARNPIAKMGYTGDDSTTRKCQVIPDKANRFVYSDCQGFEDTRGLSAQMYNAFSIMEVVNISQKIQGVLVCISWKEMLQSNNTSTERTLSALHFLLKEFTPHSNSLLFVITHLKKTTKLADVSQKLEKKIKALKGTYSDAFGTFCQQILDSKILESSRQQIVLSDPLQPHAKDHILKAIASFTPPAVKNFGYPISEKIEIVFEKARSAIDSVAKNSLNDLMNTLSTQRKNELAQDLTVACAKRWYDNLTLWLIDLAPPTLETFANKEPYKGLSTPLTDKLQKCGQLWKKIDEVDAPQNRTTTFDDKLRLELDRAKTVVSEMQKATKVKYYNRMYQEIKQKLEEFLYSYEGRALNLLQEMKKIKNILTIEAMDVAQTYDVAKSLCTIQKVALPYEPIFSDILTEDPQKLKELQQCIKTAFWPWDYQNPTWRGTGSLNHSIYITIKIPRISLSEILADDTIKSALPQAKLLSIQMGPQLNPSVFYIDSDLKEENKILSIQAGCIEVKKDSQIFLKNGSLTLFGKHQGEYDDSSSQGVKLKVKGTVQEKRAWGWKWS